MTGRRLTDYGGMHAKGSSVNTRRVSPENCFSMRCISCDRLHYVSKIELARTCRPRCSHCGGGLSEIEANYYKRLGCTPKQLKKQKIADDAQKPFKCRHCTAAFRNEAALTLHTREKHGESRDPRHSLGTDAV